ncbi:restriction endonuclease subunit S [Escherichia coli]|uniref:restriction endonuclease subunit S n=1 Tax=Escherichia coli TaxID=562 RepID=UPI001786CC14|nr:restriction endonuclease subunit S [Escherichia coli]
MGSKWCIYRLGDIAEFSYGKMPKKEFVGTGDYVIFSGYKYTESYPEKNTSAGELIVVARGVGGTGDVKITTRDCYLTNLSIKINLDETKVRKEYFYYLFLQSNLRYLDSGSAQSQITINDLANVEISAPSLNVQDLIVKSLKAFDDKITTLSSMNQTLEQMSQTLFKSWFVDFDPVIDNALDAGNPIPEALQARAELRQKVRNSADFKPLPTEIRSLFPSEFEETELGWVPKGWQIKSLDHIANFQNGLALQKFRPKNMEDDYLPVLKIADLRAGQITNDERARTDISDSCKVYDGDMIFSWSGTLMIDIWTGGNAALNQHLYKVTSKKYPQSFYFMWTIQHLSRFQHIAEAKAVTMGHIKKGDLSNSFCLIPTSSLITKYDNIVGGYLAKIKNQRLLNNQMTALRDTLLPKLISGELSLDG